MNDPDYSPPDDTLVAWQSADDVGATGILHVILALILFSGRSLPDRECHRPFGLPFTRSISIIF